jgi:hypothetical protein
VASNLSDFLWLIADGVGPYEATVYSDWAGREISDALRIAERFAETQRRSGAAIVAEAREAHPEFPQLIDELCR